MPALTRSVGLPPAEAGGAVPSAMNLLAQTKQAPDVPAHHRAAPPLPPLARTEQVQDAPAQHHDASQPALAQTEQVQSAMNTHHRVGAR